MVGFLACLIAYVPAVAYRMLMPSGWLRKDKATGKTYVELSGVHHLFAMAVTDLKYSPLSTSTTSGAEDLAGSSSPTRSPRWDALASAILLTVLVIATLTLFVFAVTGDTVSACQLRISGR